MLHPIFRQVLKTRQSSMKLGVTGFTVSRLLFVVVEAMCLVCQALFLVKRTLLVSSLPYTCVYIWRDTKSRKKFNRLKLVSTHKAERVTDKVRRWKMT